MKNKNILLLLLLLIVATVFAQAQKKIRLVSADKATKDELIMPDVLHIVGNAIFEHEGAYLYCDSALLNEKTNNLNCFGHVRIKSGDTLNLTGDLLDYNGATRVAKVTGQIVKLVDKQTTLLSDYINYDRNSNSAYYETGGIITSRDKNKDDNRLTSRKGYYYTNLKEYFFSEKVVLKNKRYTMTSDSMIYFTDTRIAFFKGPTTIKGKDQDLYCESGWYNTEIDIGSLTKHAKIINDKRILTGDSIFFDKANDVGKGYRNVTLLDTTNNVILKGDYGEVWNKKGFGFMTHKAMAIMIQKKKDSLFMHADTLRATFDTAHNTKLLFAYHKVKFFNDSIQGVCDSMVFVTKDSILNLFKSPVIWSGKNQLSADTIRLFTKNKEVSKLIMYNTAFIISRDTLENFNQVKGKLMTAFFIHNKISRINVDGSSESLYYVRQDDRLLIGVNKAISSSLVVYMDDQQKVKKITWIQKPTNVLYPEKDLPKEEKRLRDFKWIEIGRPLKKADIFN
jgi:lipopolysaccharide export system protein LptA